MKSEYFEWSKHIDTFVGNVDGMELNLIKYIPVKMNNKDRMKLAIEKWQMVVDMRILHPRMHLDEGGPATCPLCARYFYEECIGCPIEKKTGQAGCEGTPYASSLLVDNKAEVAFLKKLYKEMK
jgi:hypothetical protein